MSDPSASDALVAALKRAARKMDQIIPRVGEVVAAIRRGAGGERT